LKQLENPNLSKSPKIVGLILGADAYSYFICSMLSEAKHSDANRYAVCWRG
jgi:hypothetical protein